MATELIYDMRRLNYCTFEMDGKRFNINRYGRTNNFGNFVNLCFSDAPVVAMPRGEFTNKLLSGTIKIVEAPNG